MVRTVLLVTSVYECPSVPGAQPFTLSKEAQTADSGDYVERGKLCRLQSVFSLAELVVVISTSTLRLDEPRE